VIRQRLADLESVGELRLQGGAPEANPPAAPKAGAPAGWPPVAGSGTGGGDRGAGGPAPSGHVAAPGERPGLGWSPPRAGLLSSAPPSDAQFSRDELCRAAGTSADQLAELEAFGLIAARGATERGSWYGGDDLVVLRLARELANYGLEARHLRMYKTFAEREAALFEQVVAPLLRQRNPESRARAREMLDSLAELGSRMRDVALRTAIGSFAEGTERRR